MIYHSYNFVDSYSNASGNRKDKMVLGELGKLIRNHRNEVIVAIEDADIKVPQGITNRGIIKLIIQNKRNRRLINNLSVLIFSSSSFDGGYDFLGKNKTDGSASDEAKSGILSRVGDWMKARKERRAERKNDPNRKSLFQRIGGFLDKNKDKIGDISSGLSDSLSQGQAQNIVANNLRTTYTPKSGTTQTSGNMSANTKTYLIIGAVAVVGIFLYMRNKK